MALYPRPRRRTLQGGTGVSRTYGGTPNAGAMGITNQFLGSNPPARRILPGVDPRNRNSRGLPPEIPEWKRLRQVGLNPNRFLRDDYEGPRDPMEHLGTWEKAGWKLRNGRFVWAGPGRPPSGGRVPPGGPDRGGAGPGGSDANPNGLGMPLDALFEGDRRVLGDTLQARLAELQSSFNMGNAQVDEQGMLQNRGLDANMASRGLFGSGLERRGERLIGNDVARSKMGLLQALTSGQSAANMDNERGLQEALLALAGRNQQDKYLPLPGRERGQQQGRKRRRRRRKNRG